MKVSECSAGLAIFLHLMLRVWKLVDHNKKEIIPRNPEFPFLPALMSEASLSSNIKNIRPPFIIFFFSPVIHYWSGWKNPEKNVIHNELLNHFRRSKGNEVLKLSHEMALIFYREQLLTTKWTNEHSECNGSTWHARSWIPRDARLLSIPAKTMEV